jgi:hypothetical protein
MTEILYIMKLYLQVNAGMCNRLRALISGLLWAEDLSTKLHLYWPIEPGHFSADLDNLVDIKSIENLGEIHRGYLQRAHQVLNVDDMLTVRKVWTTEDLRIKSYSIFHPEFLTRGAEILRKLKFCRQGEADALWAAFPRKPHLGIHIRNVGFNTLQVSQIYEKEIKSFLGPFYLATDDEEVKRYFTSKYEGRAECAKVTLGRISITAQLDGLLEWLVLSKCKVIIATSGSSYSELASLLGGGQLVPAST